MSLLLHRSKHLSEMSCTLSVELWVLKKNLHNFEKYFPVMGIVSFMYTQSTDRMISLQIVPIGTCFIMLSFIPTCYIYAPQAEGFNFVTIATNMEGKLRSHHHDQKSSCTQSLYPIKFYRHTFITISTSVALPTLWHMQYWYLLLLRVWLCEVKWKPNLYPCLIHTYL